MGELPPTVIGPLLQGGSTVRIEGIDTTRDLVIEVGFGPQVVAPRRWRVSPNRSVLFFDLGVPLAAGQYVRAASFVAAPNPVVWSPSVAVYPISNAAAAASAPHPTWFVHPLGDTVAVRGAPPGLEVRVLQEQPQPGGSKKFVVVGSATATFGGNAYVPVTALTSGVDDGVVAQVTGGVNTPIPSVPRIQWPPVPVIDRIFSGQRSVVVRGAMPGARVGLLLGGLLVGEAIATVAGVAEIATVALLTGFVIGAVYLSPAGPPAVPVVVEDVAFCEDRALLAHFADEMVYPNIRGPIHVGDTAVWVDAWVPGVDVEVHLFELTLDESLPGRNDGIGSNTLAIGPVETFGPRAAPRGQGRPGGPLGQIALPVRLHASGAAPDSRTWVQVVQRLAGHTLRSIGVRVEPLEHWVGGGEIPRPVVLEPVTDCGLAVRVARVVPGAWVTVYQDDSWAGAARAGFGGSVEVPVLRLEHGREIIAIQQVQALVEDASLFYAASGASSAVQGAKFDVPADYFARSPIALVGHSNGGEIVLYEAATNTSGVAITTVLAVAPSSYAVSVGSDGPFEVDAVGGGLSIGMPVLYLFGSHDYFIYDPRPNLRPWDWLPTFTGPNTLVWVEGATHEDWNTLWSERTLDRPDKSLFVGNYARERSGLRPWQVEQVLELLGATFLADHLLGLDGFRPYFAGAVLPEAIENLPIHISSFSSPAASGLMIDTFEAADKATNDLALPNRFPTVGLGLAREVDITSVSDLEAPTFIFANLGAWLALEWWVPLATSAGLWGDFRTELPAVKVSSNQYLGMEVAVLSTSERIRPTAASPVGQPLLLGSPVALAMYPAVPASGLDVVARLHGSGGAASASVRLGVFRPLPAGALHGGVEFDDVEPGSQSSLTWMPATVWLPTAAFGGGVQGFKPGDTLGSIALELRTIAQEGGLVIDRLRLEVP